MISGYGAAPKVLTYQGATAFGSGSSQTYTAAPIGTAAADRYVIVAVAGAGTGASTISTLTVAGNAMTRVTGATSGNTDVEIFILLVTSGTTADIIATFGGSKAGSNIAVWTATGLTSATAVGTNTSTTNNSATALTTVAGGFAIGATGNNNSTSYTWTNLTEKYDQAGGSRTFSGASDATTGTSVSVTSNGASTSSPVMALASW